MAYDNTNTGSLKKNNKGDNDKRPDRRGKINIEGVVYNLSGWIRKGEDGEQWLSLKATRDDQQEGGKTQARPAQPASRLQDNEDIEF